MKSVTITKPAVTDMARRLAAFLRDKHHVEMKHSHAMDAIAAIFGYRSRQAMRAEIDDTPVDAEVAKDERRQVFVLRIEHRHGDDVSVHTSREGARNALASYVDDWWNEVADNLDEPVEFSSLDRDAAIDLYFEHQTDEYFHIDDSIVDFGEAS